MENLPIAAVTALGETGDLPEEFLALWRKEEETPEQEEYQEEEEEEYQEEEQEEDEFWKQLEERCKQEGPCKEENRKQPAREEEKRRAGWKPSEMDLLMDISVLLTEKKMDELEELYAKKLALKEAEQEGVDAKLMAHFCKQEGVDAKLMAHFQEYFPDYFATQVERSKRNPDLVFEDITNILPMRYTDERVPRYVYEGRANSLQIYSAKVEEGGLQWPLHVYGVVAVRDSIDRKRNLIFYRTRDYCQVITEEDPYLVLTGPTRAVGMNEPVTIEAELKVKGRVESEDKYFIAQSRTVPLTFDPYFVEFGDYEAGGLVPKFEKKLNVLVGGLGAPSLEATIFIQIIDGTLPVGFHGQISASTATELEHVEIILVKFGGGDGNMEHLRHVVSVDAFGVLAVFFRAQKSDEQTVEGWVHFKAQMSGRSFSYLKVGSCKLGVLVVWSRIRPMCEEELVSESHMDLF